MLSKTDFLLYLEAPMHLWAKAHQQMQVKPPTPLESFLAQQGQTIEALAKTHIEEVILPCYDEAHLYWQQSFEDGRFQIRTDALVFDHDKQRYDLYEVKSSTSVSSQHKYDLAFQTLLLQSQIDLDRVFILHVQKDYRLEEEFDLSQFLTVTELTSDLEKYLQEVAILREYAYQVTQLNEPQPDFACTKPHTCPCPDLCHPNLPDHPVYELPYMGKKATKLREMGITAVKDIPSSFDLNPKQRKHVEAIRHKTPIIDRQGIRYALSQLIFPLYFLDYETFNPAIPLFRRYHPYDPIVFQYSLFVVSTPDEEPQHFDCLLTGSEDPACEIVKNLLGHIGETGSVIVWNQSFEARCNQKLASYCPQYTERLIAINERLFDLMLIFRDGLYIHPDFHGSASLKAVLPVLCPELSYEALSISNGKQAMLTWYDLQNGRVPQTVREEVEQTLKTYCKLDTWGMVKLWDKLREI